MIEMKTIQENFVRELGTNQPRPDVIAHDAHRLLGAARTLGAQVLSAELNAFQKLQPRESTVFPAENAHALRRVIDETNLALANLEAFASEILSVRKSDASSKPVAIYRRILPR
jgi:HPt (histidine-containing phosphotransfer) domain-containing protein